MKIFKNMIYLAFTTVFLLIGCEYGDIAELAAKKLSPSLFVAVGDSGTILYSKDGIAWNIADSTGYTNKLCDVASGNGSIVAVGYNGIVLTSRDGKTWTSPLGTVGSDIMSVCYGNGRFVFVAEYFAGYTADLLTWVNQSSSVASSALYNIFYGDNRFLATGSAAAFVTPDGSTWQDCTPGTGFYQGGIYANGRFTIVGQNYMLRYSTDLINWYNSNAGGYADVPNIMFGIAYGNGIYVIAGGAGQIARSVDGLNWTSNTISSSDLLGVTYGNGKFVAVEMNGKIWYSADGITWTMANSPTSYSLNAITFRP